MAKESCALVSSTKSERSARDSEAPMGVAASNVQAGVAASVGALNAVVPHCDKLNATETVFPRSNLRLSLILQLGTSQNPSDQLV